MIDILLLFLGILGIIIFGFFVVKLILPKSFLLEALALGYLVGIGLFTYILFLLNLIGIQFNIVATNTLLAFLTLLAAMLSISMNKNNKIYFYNLNINFKSFKLHEMLIIFLVGLLFISALIYNFYWPVKDWDSLVLYDYRAQAFVSTGGISSLLDWDYFFGYPLLTSLAHTYVYIMNIKNPMFIYGLFYISFLISIYYFLRNYLTRFKSLFFILLIGVLPLIYSHSMIAYTNLAYSVYLVIGVLFLYQWTKTYHIRFLIISALMTGLSTWTRTAEPFWLANIAILGFWIILFGLSRLTVSKKLTISLFEIPDLKFTYLLRLWIKSITIYCLIFFLLQLPWKMFVTSIHNNAFSANPVVQLTSGVSHISITQNIELIAKVLDYLYRFVIEPQLILFIALILGLLYQVINQKKLDFFIILLTYLLMLILGTYVFALSYSGWQEIHGSLERMAIFLAPLLIIFIALLFVEKKKKV